MADSRAQILAHQMIEIRHLIGLDPERMKRAINLDLNLGTILVGVVEGISNIFHHSEINDVKEKQNHLYHSVDMMGKRLEVTKEMVVKNHHFIANVSAQTKTNFYLTQVHFFKSLFFELSMTAEKILTYRLWAAGPGKSRQVQAGGLIVRKVCKTSGFQVTRPKNDVKPQFFEPPTGKPL